jgi:hypothetical protein
MKVGAPFDRRLKQPQKGWRVSRDVGLEQAVKASGGWMLVCREHAILISSRFTGSRFTNRPTLENKVSTGRSFSRLCKFASQPCERRFALRPRYQQLNLL